MKNVVIIVALAAVLAVVGFFGTIEIAWRAQRAQARRTGASLPDNATMADHMRENDLRRSRAEDAYERREGYARIGGGVGAVAGFLLGLCIVTWLDRKRKAPEPPPNE